MKEDKTFQTSDLFIHSVGTSHLHGYPFILVSIWLIRVYGVLEIDNTSRSEKETRKGETIEGGRNDKSHICQDINNLYLVKKQIPFHSH